VTHPGHPGEAMRIASALRGATRALPAFTRADQLVIRARLCASLEEFTERTGLARTAGAGVVEGEIVFPPASVPARLEDLSAPALHEVAHLALETRAPKDLPRWFVEGLVATVAPRGAMAAPRCDLPARSLDSLLRSANVEARSEGYRRSARLVAMLAQEAGGVEAFWKSVQEQKTFASILGLRLGAHTVKDRLRSAPKCP